jgi:hypothetical protein
VRKADTQFELYNLESRLHWQADPQEEIPLSNVSLEHRFEVSVDFAFVA